MTSPSVRRILTARRGRNKSEITGGAATNGDAILLDIGFREWYDIRDGQLGTKGKGRKAGADARQCVPTEAVIEGQEGPIYDSAKRTQFNFSKMEAYPPI
jgi:hypothetical protein